MGEVELWLQSFFTSVLPEVLSASRHNRRKGQSLVDATVGQDVGTWPLFHHRACCYQYLLKPTHAQLKSHIKTPYRWRRLFWVACAWYSWRCKTVLPVWHLQSLFHHRACCYQYLLKPTHAQLKSHIKMCFNP